MPSSTAPSSASSDRRWRTAVAFLDEVRRTPGATRAAVARRLAITSGSATELTARLRELDLIAETAAEPRGRGRPTSTLHPHPDGPVVVIVDLRHEDWRCAVAGIDAFPAVVASGRHRTRTPRRVLTPIADAVEAATTEHAGRVVAVSIAVAGTVENGHLVQASTLQWSRTDLTALARPPATPLLIGNDATLAGLAEARTGAARGAATALHVTVEVGVGGALIIDGRPAVGGRGAGGEFGHLPFGDHRLRCPCGARGCWDLEVDGRALARHRGDKPPDDPRNYALRVLELAPTDADAARATATVARSLAGGLAGLVNALDPDIVTIGGLAPALRATAPRSFAEAYLAGLMMFRRSAPPAVLDAHHGEAGPLHGAAIAALDATITEPGLAAWARTRTIRTRA
ncbi:MAG: ROK family protein [Acidimicrobiia bacterium]|nr:ROK family protein [Acidimicrobiia bacterium]